MNEIKTGEIKSKKSGNNESGKCGLCGNLESLAHILNGCKKQNHKYKERHNLIEQRLVNYFKKRYPDCSIHRSVSLKTVIPELNLKDELSILKPDVIIKSEGNLIVLEISCPYGMMKDTDIGRRSTLDITFNTKLEKYKELIEETKKQTGLKVIYEPIIVSSLGAITKKSSNRF